MSNNDVMPGFNELNLSDGVLKALDDVGYETPSPIQAITIPFMMEGRDVLGQAQTGTGKTAAFALPILSRIDVKKLKPQVLVLAPTRELAIQVSEAFQKYASHISGFHVAPIYGGQDYNSQLRQLRRGVHVIVGTPGRVMDHMRRGSLKLDELQCLVLDEADEMLRMGFIDDVEWILEQTPAERQTALFSATMPKEIRRIAERYLKNPEVISIKVKTTTADTIRQRFWKVSGLHKLDALTRILEAEPFDAMLVFVRTKSATVELAEKLEARGFNATALNGDIVQKQRERTIEHLKNGKIDILVATDVAARGLDVDRISHVINFDIPYDTESYIHRVGRTGRAGRTGDAILFVAPREHRLLTAIEKATRQKITPMQMPSTKLINDNRIANFKQRITDTLALEDMSFYSELIEQYIQEHNIPALEIAGALAKLVQGKKPLLLDDRPEKDKFDFRDEFDKLNEDGGDELQKGMERYRLEVGRRHNVKAGNIVGAICNETGMENRYIGHIDIQQEFTTIDLPKGMPRQMLRTLKKVRVAGQPMNIIKLSGKFDSSSGGSGGSGGGKKNYKGRSGGKKGGFGGKKKFGGGDKRRKKNDR